MNEKEIFGLLGTAALTVMLGCSTSKPVPEIEAVSSDLLPPAGIESGYYAQLIPPQPLTESPGRVCLLGTTCLSMDQRPFEPCLLSTRHCRDKAAEAMQVAPPPWSIPEPNVIHVELER